MLGKTWEGSASARGVTQLRKLLICCRLHGEALCVCLSEGTDSDRSPFASSSHVCLQAAWGVGVTHPECLHAWQTPSLLLLRNAVDSERSLFLCHHHGAKLCTGVVHVQSLSEAVTFSGRPLRGNIMERMFAGCLRGGACC
jgi:hypothetical protein